MTPITRPARAYWTTSVVSTIPAVSEPRRSFRQGGERHDRPGSAAPQGAPASARRGEGSGPQRGRKENRRAVVGLLVLRVLEDQHRWRPLVPGDALGPRKRHLATDPGIELAALQLRDD